MNFSTRTAISIFLVAGVATAQLGKPKGLSVEVTTPIGIDLKDTYKNSIGVIRASNGDYYVGTGKAKATGRHKLVRITDVGVIVAHWDQPAEIAAAPVGLYDMAYDEQANIIYGGTDYSVSRRLFAFDVKAGRFDATKSIFIPPTVAGSAARGLTFNPDGDMGNGSFFIADGGSVVSEISTSGKLLRTVPNVHPATQALAFDDESQLIWCFGPGATTRKDQGVVGIPFELATGKVSGLRVLGDNAIPGQPAGGTVRGAQIWESSATDHEELWLLVLTDANEDWFYEMHAAFVVEDGCAGEISFDGDACYSGNAAWGVRLENSTASVASLCVATAEFLDGVPLLAPFKPNCRLYPRIDSGFTIFSPVGVVGGEARQGVAIPRDRSLIGISLFFQWFEVEQSGMTPLGMSEEGEAYIHN